MIVKNNPRTLGLPIDRTIVHGVFPEWSNFSKPYLYPHLKPGQKKPNKWIAAGGFGGTPLAIHRFYQAYYRTFWEMLWQKIYVGDEQLVMGNTCQRHPSTCFVYYKGSGNWFAMARVFSQNTTIQESPVTGFIAPRRDLPIPPRIIETIKD